jgi:hypothetical protein
MKKLIVISIVMVTIIYSLIIFLTDGNIYLFCNILQENHYDLFTWIIISIQNLIS